MENIKEKAKKRESSFNNGENQLSRYRENKKSMLNKDRSGNRRQRWIGEVNTTWRLQEMRRSGTEERCMNETKS